MSPYEEAWHWVAANSGTESARGLAKLLLSLWLPSTFAFPVAVCVDNLDESTTELALRAIIHYSNFEDKDELRQIGEWLQRRYPELSLSGRTAAVVMNSMGSRGTDGRIHRQYTLASQADADELDVAWQEIVTQQLRPRMEAIARDTEDVVERARKGLDVLVGAIREHPGTGQSRRLVRFIAGMYNGEAYPFDLTDLRALDQRLSSACLDYLAYDVLGKQEVHRHLQGADQTLHGWLRNDHIRPTAHLKRDLKERLAAMALRLDQDDGKLLNNAVEDLVRHDEANRFVGLETRFKKCEEDDVMHVASKSSAARADAKVLSPLCGNPRGPLHPTSYDFSRITCPDCLERMLFPDYE